MKSRASILVFIFFILRFSALDLSSAEVETPDLKLDEKSPSTDEHKLLLECQHPDYRTYIKCLKRQKRHHHHSDHESEGGETRRCFDDCGMEQCESTKCVHECHKRCMKKTKETRQIITQYETTCGSDDCEEKSERGELPTTNVTTNIDINNVIHNHMPQKPAEGAGGSSGGAGGTGTSGGPGGSGSGVGGGGQPGPNAPGPGGPSNWPCGTGYFGCDTSLSLVPQIQFVPQITFGLGIQQSGGYWPNPQSGRVDCSYCGNPLMRYRCDVSCYPMQASGSILPNAGRVGTSNVNCIAPHCVGGT